MKLTNEISNNEKLLEILTKMGAKDAKYEEKLYDNEVISFYFENKKIEIIGLWCQFGSGALTSTVIDV